MKNSIASNVAASWKLLARDTRGETDVSALANLCDLANPNYDKESCYRVAVAKGALESFRQNNFSFFVIGTFMAGLFLFAAVAFASHVFVQPIDPTGAPAFFAVLCGGIGIVLIVCLVKRARTDIRLEKRVDQYTVIFFEQAAELYTILFERLSGATTAEKLRLRIESTAVDLAEVIKNRPAVVGPADLVEESSAEERKLLRAAVGLIVHLKLMDTDKINAMLFDESDWEALQKYRAERVYQKLFETTQAA